jgi:hypothetical protein
MTLTPHAPAATDRPGAPPPRRRPCAARGAAARPAGSPEQTQFRPPRSRPAGQPVCLKFYRFKGFRTEIPRCVGARGWATLAERSRHLVDRSRRLGRVTPSSRSGQPCPIHDPRSWGAGTRPELPEQTQSRPRRRALALRDFGANPHRLIPCEIGSRGDGFGGVAGEIANAGRSFAPTEGTIRPGHALDSVRVAGSVFHAAQRHDWRAGATESAARSPRTKPFSRPRGRRCFDLSS